MIKEEPLVSIILVNYNGMKDTIECIDSIMKIDYKNFNIIVLDNGSSNREDLPDEYLNNEKVFYLWNDENKGFAGGNNIACRYAIEKLKAEYLLLLNNDTIVTSDFLSVMMKCIIRCGDKTVVTGKIYYYSDHRKLWYYGGSVDLKRGLAVHYTDENRYKDKRYPQVSFASGCLLLLSTDAYIEIDGIPEKYFLYYEDVDMCCLLRNRGYKLRLCKDAIIYHKVNASTGTKSDLAIYYGSRNRLYFVKKYGINKKLGYMATYVMCLRSLLRKPSRYKVIIKAISDFVKGRQAMQYADK